MDDQAPVVGRQYQVLARQKGLAPQEPQDSSPLVGGLAGQGHRAGILHEIQAWGHNAGLGQHFWKHTERDGVGGQGPFLSLLPRRAPQGFPTICVYVLWVVCVCSLPMAALYGRYECVLCDNYARYRFCVYGECVVYGRVCMSLCLLYIDVL